MLLEANGVGGHGVGRGRGRGWTRTRERPLLLQVLRRNAPGDELIEESLVTYINSLKIAADNHNKTKQEAEIYTDWANHYLEKARFKRYVQDLQVDVSDGVLLADVIEAVTNEKVRSINRKPKNSSQMIENINNCLALLSALGVSVDGVVAKDIRDGNLKAILSLFFSLSRHKQQQKQATVATTPANGPVNGPGDMLSKLPSPFRQQQQQQVNSCGKPSSGVSGSCSGAGTGSGGSGGGSSIPTPSSVVSRKQTSDRGRGGTATTAGPVAPLPAKAPSAASSRSASPGVPPNHSFIPQPTLTKSSSVRNCSTDKHPLKTVSGGLAAGKSSNVILRSNSHHHPNNVNKNNISNTNNQSKNSMLDKLKFFNTKEKSERNKAPGISKRTSSSSGFSSARSERSDSSNSLCSEPKPTSCSTSSETRESSPAASASTSGNSSPRLAVKAFARKTFGKSTTNSSSKDKIITPTSSPKDLRKPDAKPSKSKAVTSKISNNNNCIKPVALDYSDGKHDSKTKRLSYSAEPPASNDVKGNDSSSTKEPDQNGHADDLETENHARSSKVSLIPKGDKGNKSLTGIGKQQQQCPLKDSSTTESISAKGSSAAIATMAGTNASQTTAVLNSLVGATSIPKPTAAVKGTSKAPKEDRHSVTGSSSNLNQNSSSMISVSSSGANNVKDVRASNGPLNNKIALPSKGIHRVAPAKSDASTLTDPPKSVVSLQSSGGILMSSLPRNCKSDRSRTDGGPVGVSIAMVSPMQSQCKEDSFQEQASSNGHGGNQNSERTSKGISPKVDILSQQRSSPKLSTSTYSKMETTFDSSDKVITRETTPGTPRETTFSEESEDIVVNIKPMQPIVRASPYSYMRNLGVYTARSIAPSIHIGSPSSGLGGAGSVNRLNLGRHQALTTSSAGSDPLQLYAYTSQLKRALVGGSGMLETDYAATTDHLNLAAGYMSDGDTLRSDGRSDDIGSGYMSEGGASLYARRLAAKAREAPATIKECPHKAAAAFFSGDSFDDSSSVSSGISDTIAEISTDDNLTGSSVSSDQTNPYASLKRSPKDVIIRNHVASGPKKMTSAELHGRLANGRTAKASSVKKADCAQQTENSAFRQVSSSAWKKYLLDKEPQGRCSDPSQRLPQDKADLLRRGKSDLDPSKTRDKRTCGGTSSSSIGILRKSTTASGAALHGGLEKPSSPKSKRKGLSGAGGSSSSTGSGAMRQRVSTENLMNGPTVKGRDDINYVGSSDMQGQSRVQNLRNPQVGPGIRCYSSNRPPSTCSVSSNSSSKSAGSRISNKRSSSEKLSEYDRTDMSSEAAYYSSELSRTLANSGIPRPGSAPIRSEQQYLQHHHLLQHQQMMHSGVRGAVDRKAKVCSSMQTGVNEMHHQDYQSCSNGGSTNDNESECSSVSGYYQKGQNATSASSCLSPAPGHKIYSTRTIMNSTGTPSDLAHAAQSNCSPRLSVHSVKPQELQLAASSPPTSSSLYGIVGLDHSAFGAGSGGTYPWLRHSPSAASALSRPGGRSSSGSGWLTEAESVESLASSLASSVHAHLQHARANSLTHARLLLHQRETSASPVPRLSRSNSIRSTKSEKLYPSMLQRSGDVEPFLNGSLCSSAHSPGHKERDPRQTQTLQLHHHHHHHQSQPASPTPGNQNGPGFAYPMNNSVLPSSCSGTAMSKSLPKDELHGSALSLVSTNSSLYSSSEEKQAQEIRKLRRELMDAHDRVQDLTSQLSTNKLRQAKAYGRKMDYSTSKSSCIQYPAHQFQAHVVAAFEQSLSNMTSRLQALTTSSERKDSELNELRSTIEALRKKSVEAGLTSGNLPSMHRSPNLVRRHTFNTSKDSALTALQEQHMSRQLSTDSVSSINSLSSACSVASQTSGASQKSNDPCAAVLAKKKKKKGWLRSSFSKAFSRSKKNKNGSVSDVEDRQLQSDTSAPNSPLLCSPHMMNAQGMKISHSSNAIYDKDDTSPAPEMVQELKKQLREKDMVLTDIRLEALTSAHQLESLKETVTKMRSEMLNLKEDNKRLQRLVSNKSLTSSQSSLHSTQSADKRSSNTDEMSPICADILSNDGLFDSEGKRITIVVFLGCHGDYEKYLNPSEGQRTLEALIGSVNINSKTKWDVLDSFVRRIFKEYILRIDPVTNLGLNADSIASYNLGEVIRCKDSELPDLLPYGYVIGDVLELKITLKGTKQNSVDALSFETLTPKSIVHRYISLLSEHRRIILCGPSGTGKTYLAHRLSEFLVLRSGKELLPGTIATFSVDHKSAKELRQYLSNVAEQCENSAADLPSVIILDNLHHVGSLGEVFNGFLNAKYQKCPFIIGTMNQTTCSTTNLQLHHNFRWVLCANHMEPVKGFLGRYLRRKLIEHEVRTASQNNDLTKVIDWMSKTWHHLNKFLETHSSSDVTIGPRLFLSCPTDISASQVWFTDLWNYSIVPYLLEAVREGLQLYGRRATWEDPTVWVMETFPWPPASQSGDWPPLLHLRPEDVGYDMNSSSITVGSKGLQPAAHEMENDPLLNMLMRLQEAANYSSPHSNDSDTTSLDSHSSSLQTEETLGVESTI